MWNVTILKYSLVHLLPKDVSVINLFKRLTECTRSRLFHKHVVHTESQWICYFLRTCFFPSITANTFAGLYTCMSNTLVSYKKLVVREHLSSPPVLCWGLCCSSFLLYVLSYCVSLSTVFRVVMRATISTSTRC